MLEYVALILGALGTITGTSLGAYKIYKECTKDTPSVVIHNNHTTPPMNLDQMIIDELKNRKSGDSETSVDIKINIHTHEEEN